MITISADEGHFGFWSIDVRHWDLTTSTTFVMVKSVTMVYDITFDCKRMFSHC